jgi:hypothetical protein
MTRVMKIEEINYLVATSFTSHIHENKISFQVLLYISHFFFSFGCVSCAMKLAKFTSTNWPREGF